LKNETNAIATTKTDAQGAYIFPNVEPGDYKVVEINPPKFPSSLSDQDNSNDGDVGDTDTTVDDTIAVTVKPGEDERDNDFVDSDRGSISGSVKDDKGNPLVGVTIVLKTPMVTLLTPCMTNLHWPVLLQQR
jgi:protocatechuate 3,4-dioxygenase beta subunit